MNTSGQGLVPPLGRLRARHSTLGWLALEEGPMTGARPLFYLRVEALVLAFREGAFLACIIESCQSRNNEQFRTNVLPLGKGACLLVFIIQIYNDLNWQN